MIRLTFLIAMTSCFLAYIFHPDRANAEYHEIVVYGLLISIILILMPANEGFVKALPTCLALLPQLSNGICDYFAVKLIEFK